jgi:hypothetical protein
MTYLLSDWWLEEGNPLECPLGKEILRECLKVADMLLVKNRKYGDVALDPVRVFSRASPLEQIKVRLDDKLSRLKSGQSDEDEDVEQDILGYLILLRIARQRAK